MHRGWGLTAMSNVRARIIVVDDSATALVFTQRALERGGHKVTTTDNPILLPGLIRTERPDLVLVDVNIPLIDGDEAVGLLRRSTANDHWTRKTLVVLYSSLGDEELKARAEQCGADGYVVKGDAETLLATVNTLLDRGR